MAEVLSWESSSNEAEGENVECGGFLNVLKEFDNKRETKEVNQNSEAKGKKILIYFFSNKPFIVMFFIMRVKYYCYERKT